VEVARKDNVHHVGHHVDAFFGGRAEVCDVFVATLANRNGIRETEDPNIDSGLWPHLSV